MLAARLVLATLAVMVTASPARGQAPESLYVLAINGGGDKADNFASHLGHLRQLVELLAAAGIPRDHVTVLSSDGSDPAPDLATREPDPENAWLLSGTRLASILRGMTRYENSILPGVTLHPATRAGVAQAVDALRHKLRPHDTLLVYVTDHGAQDLGNRGSRGGRGDGGNRGDPRGWRDPRGNSITLWGSQSISVRELGTLLGRLPGEARIVSLMSQCFSGGFAYLYERRERRRRPSGHTCGYFSSTPDRPAYGCYPEVRGQKAIGHSFAFLSALARRGDFAAAHADVVLDDEAPDIPLRTTDIFLADELSAAAGSPAREDAFLAPLIRRALADPTLAPHLAQLDRIASIYGVGRPASLQDLEREASQLDALVDQTEANAQAWESALADFNQASIEGFLATHPAWRARLDERAMSHLDDDALRSLAPALLADLERYVAAEPARMVEANSMLDGLNSNDEIGYRTEIRLAALLRARFILTSMAGRLWVQSHQRTREELDALDRCESLLLPVRAKLPRMAEPPAPSKLPPLDEDRQKAATSRPGWLGVAFVPAMRRKGIFLPAGAARITAVARDSPAAHAGFRPGDIVLGLPGHSFAYRGDLHPFIASSRPGSVLNLEVLRGRARLLIPTTISAAPAP